jgi:hypothetical protein
MEVTPDAAFAEILAGARPRTSVQRFAHSPVVAAPHGVDLA